MKTQFDYDQKRKSILVEWRKRVISARENWLANIKLTRQTDFIWLRRRKFIAFCKNEAAEALKQERACTQLIEFIDGKRASINNIPKELTLAFNFCRNLAELDHLNS